MPSSVYNFAHFASRKEKVSRFLLKRQLSFARLSRFHHPCEKDHSAFSVAN